MSVIFLKESITNERSEFERSKKSFNSKLLTVHADDNSDVSSDDFSLDITLGSSWNENYSYNDRSLFLIEGDSITIKPKGSVVVSIREKIIVPNNMFGLVISTGSIFLQHGVQSPAAKVEPGYEGILILRLVNYSDVPVLIKKGAKIASVVFFRTEHTPEYTFASNSEGVNIKKKGRVEVIMLGLKNIVINHGFKLATIIISILSLSCTYALYSYNVKNISNDRQQKQEKIIKTESSKNDDHR